MGFFDFLASPAQDPSLQDQELWAKKKKQQETPQSYGNEALESAQYDAAEAKKESAKTLKGTILENERSDEARKGLLKDYDRAVKDAHSALLLADNSLRRDGPLSPDAVKSIRLVQRAVKEKESPVVLADDFQRLSENPEFNSQERTAFAGAAAMFRRAQKSRDAATEALNVPKMVPSPESLEAERANVEALTRQENAARQQMATMGVTNPQREASQRAIAEIVKEREEAQTRLRQVGTNANTLAAEREAAAKEAPTSATPVANQFKTLGVKKEQLLTSMLSLLEANGISLDDLDDDVPTQAGLMRLLSSMDKEGTVAQKMAADLLAEKQGFQEQMQREEAAMKGEQAAAEKRVSGIQSEMGQARSQLKELYRELNSQPFMRSWIGILSFVILSMLSGPKNAAILLGLGRNKNAVQGEIDALKEDLRYMGRQMEKEENYSQQVRREAIDRMAARGREERMYSRDVSKMMINHQLVLARAKQNSSNTGAQRLMISKLEGDYNRIVGRMKDASERMRDPYADDRDKQRAAREHQAALAEMEFLDQKLRALTERMLPGTYSSEEEEAQTP